MTAPLDAPGEWTELVAHVPGPADHGVRAVRRPPGGARVGERTAARAHHPPRRRRSASSTSATSRTSSSSTRTPSGTPTTLRYGYQSFTTPASIYEHDLVTGERVLLKQTPAPNVDLSQYIGHAASGPPRPTARWCRSTSSAGATSQPTGDAPCMVYGYGSYESSMSPWFSVGRISLLDRGWVWALVHPRGGGELGRRWYPDGKLLNKRNTFTDTIACVEHLVAGGWAHRDRVVDPRRQRRRSAGRRVHDDATRPVRRGRRRGAVRRRGHHDERPVAAADDHRVGRVGRSARRAGGQLHAQLLAVRQHRRRRLPGAVHHRRAERPAGQLPRAGEVVRQAARACAPTTRR